MLQCRGEESRTSWDDDLVVQQERYRRLGFDFDEARARADVECIVRSRRMPEVIIVGGRRLGADGEVADGVRCEYDGVIMGAKTFIAGVEKATDRAMLFGSWRRLEEPARKALYLAWFEDGLAVGREVVGEAGKAPLVAGGKAWQPPRVVIEGARYVAEGWLLGPTAARPTARYELVRCAMTEELSFEGCTVVDALGGD